MKSIDFAMLPNQPLLVALGGPSGIGKTTVIRTLLQESASKYARPLSYTSRKRRVHEDDTEYVFVTAQEILARHAAGELLNLDYVYGDYYGMSKDSIDSILTAGKFVIKEIHPSNHKKLRREYPNLISVLLTPSAAGQGIARRNLLGRNDTLYDDLDLTAFDIVYYMLNYDAPKDVARSINTAISAISKTDKYFPRPSVIDAVNRNGYAAVAGEFQDTKRITTAFFHKLSAPFFSKSITCYIKPGALCLEVGPGSGWLRGTFEWPDVSHHMADLSSDMLVSLRKRYPDIPVIEASARALPWPSETFDVILASLCDPYCYPAVLCEFSRLIRKGGYLIMSAPAKMWSDGVRESGSKNMTAFLLQNSLKTKVYSFTFHLEDLLSLLRLCHLYPVDYEEIKASQHKDACELPPAVIASCNCLEIPANKLNVMNCLVAKKCKEKN